ncbi:helix-turn-helix domain-containing protein [Halorubrum halophilum]|uniref:helix-turn-helix domain-containing protein n=1 Tax=Halorubrum halophilum TaxID=413816 RepID=UPI0006789CCE|nr:helix-turn-helix domain-containing protein [Halorubrum halophilum]
MPQARLLVDLPDGPWIADVSRDFPDAGFRVLTAVPGEGAGFALLRLTTRDVDAVLAAMRDHVALSKVSVMARGEGVATVRIETSAPLLLVAAKRSGLPIEMPLDIENGVAEVDVTGEHERVAALGKRFDELGLDYEVERVRQRVDPVRLLTDRQQELLLAAVELGYYDVPRQSTLTEVADHVGIAKSTCSETLQRVERTVVREFVDDLPNRPLDDEADGSEPTDDSDADTETDSNTDDSGDLDAETDAESTPNPQTHHS